jgi:hypothetical protein
MLVRHGMFELIAAFPGAGDACGSPAKGSNVGGREE